MLKLSLATFIATITLASISVDAYTSEAAAGYCPGRPGGKCPVEKKRSRSRSDFTPAQRQKIMEEARQVCIRNYGASSSVYRFDYRKWQVICNTPGM